MHAAGSRSDNTAILGRIRFLTRLMDGQVRIPGTRATVGLDPILGLVPGVGDAVSAAVSIYILLQARRLGASPSVLRRMALNIAADLAIGFIPVVGDAADFVFKANRRNLALLGISPDDDAEPRRSGMAGIWSALRSFSLYSRTAGVESGSPEFIRSSSTAFHAA